MLELIFGSIWYILPAYFANSSAVLLKGKTPIDLNIKFLDGKRVLGKGKTIKGFVFAIIIGTAIASIQAYLSSDITLIYLGFLISFGAMTGDSAGSFIKRRFDLKRGQAAPLLDQWDFVFGALFFAWIGSFYGLKFPNLEMVLSILVITVFIHLGSNYIAYKLKMKKEPW